MSALNCAVGDRPNRPRVLVLLASRNGAPCIACQIASVLSQHEVDVRLQIRDDNSSDSTRDIVAGLARADERVQLLADHAPSGSAGANFFALVRQADVSAVDYVALCDQDDEWFVDKLARATTRMRAEGSQGYSAAVLARWPDGREKVLAQCDATRHADYLFEGAGQGCTFVIAAELFAALQSQLRANEGLLKAIHYHDWALHALTRSSGASWTFDPRPAMVYHQHAGNDTGARTSGAGIVRRLNLIRTGWYRDQVRAIVALVLQANPRDEAAARWARIDAAHPAHAVRGRWLKARFIALNGRRKPVDRFIQLAAVVLGYL